MKDFLFERVLIPASIAAVCTALLFGWKSQPDQRGHNAWPEGIMFAILLVLVATLLTIGNL